MLTIPSVNILQLPQLQSQTQEELDALRPQGVSVLDRAIVIPARIETQSKDWLGSSPGLLY